MPVAAGSSLSHESGTPETATSDKVTNHVADPTESDTEDSGDAQLESDVSSAKDSITNTSDQSKPNTSVDSTDDSDNIKPESDVPSAEDTMTKISDRPNSDRSADPASADCTTDPSAPRCEGQLIYGAYQYNANATTDPGDPTAHAEVDGNDPTVRVKANQERVYASYWAFLISSYDTCYIQAPPRCSRVDYDVYTTGDLPQQFYLHTEFYALLGLLVPQGGPKADLAPGYSLRYGGIIIGNYGGAEVGYKRVFIFKDNSDVLVYPERGYFAVDVNNNVAGRTEIKCDFTFDCQTS
jgi:hypothetical protein